MQAYRVETTIAPDGSIKIVNLPFPRGEAVEVIILLPESRTTTTERYPLRGTPVVYHAPFEPVSEDDWSILP
ncbi:hypothetical protein [Candidatus Chloroploca asiatica]|uniref:Uncharacterized protein n=1 Tax=Candidatus Chloroploca asiatica TaxID=1506545 RepID=A0A2H3KP09_9CHLR|nr:hypothetical protein [Candidatus Chloroploca asiatica]PDV99959.1 hypothetical protein A9Q02_11025 [Candidatus Chloroploca asiatica]